MEIPAQAGRSGDLYRFQLAHKELGNQLVRRVRIQSSNFLEIQGSFRVLFREASNVSKKTVRCLNTYDFI